MRTRKILFLAVVCLGLLAGLSLTLRMAHSRSISFRGRGHSRPILAIAVSPDGKTVASMSHDEIKLWDVDTCKERATIPGSISLESTAVFSPDGNTLAATNGKDITIRLWDATTGTERATLRGHTGPVHAVAFSPDGKVLASGGEDKTVKLWDLATRKELTSLPGNPDGIYGLAFSPDGETLASGSGARAVKLWNASTRQERASFTHKCPWGLVERLAFSPDGKTLATGDSAGLVELWDVVAGTDMPILSDGHSEEITALAFSPDGKILVSVADHDGIKLWDTSSGKFTAYWPQSYRLPKPRLFRYIRTYIDDHPSIADALPGILEERTNLPLSVLYTSDGKLVALGYDRRDDSIVKMWPVAAVPTGKK